jgi:hypothetical protein
MRENGNKAPPAPQGWKSVGELCRQGVAGGSHSIRIRLERLKEELTEQLVSNGLSERDAARRVENEFVGLKSRQDVGSKGLYASPEALAMLNLKHILPKPPSAWRSASQLVQRREAKGSVLSVSTKLKVLREELIRNFIDAGSSEKEATLTVDRDLVGYRNTGFGNQEALYASPDALRMLEEKRLLIRPDQNRLRQR